MTEAEFRADLTAPAPRSRMPPAQQVTGYRAPSFSIDQRTPWAHPVLAEQGYAYSSSVAPIRHDHYGWPEAPRFAWRPVADAELIELPVTTVERRGTPLAAGGGGFFRLLPYAFSSWAIARVNGDEERPAIFYFHPWEIDPDQPRVPDAPLKSRLRHYTNLSAMRPKLLKLLNAHAMGPHRRGRRRRAGAAAMNALAPVAALAVRAADLADRDECARIDAFVADHPDGHALPPPAMEPRGRARLRPARALSGRRARRRPGRLPAADRGPLAPVRQRPGLGRLRHAAAASSPTTRRRARSPRPPGRWRGALGCPSARAARRAASRGLERRPRASMPNFDRGLPADAETLLASIPQAQRAEVRKALAGALETIGRQRPPPSRRPFPRLCRKRPQSRHAGLPARPVRGGARRVRRRCRHPHGLRRTAGRSRPCSASTSRAPASLIGAAAPSRRGDWRANDLIYFDVMRRAIARGCTRADFGRSKVGTGAWPRKRNWGFDETPLIYARAHRRRRGAARDQPARSRNTGSRSPPGSSCRSGSPTGSAR